MFWALLGGFRKEPQTLKNAFFGATPFSELGRVSRWIITSHGLHSYHGSTEQAVLCNIIDARTIQSGSILAHDSYSKRRLATTKSRIFILERSILYQNASTLNFQHFGSLAIDVSTIGISWDSKMCFTYAREHKIMGQNGSGLKGAHINYIAPLGGTVPGKRFRLLSKSYFAQKNEQNAFLLFSVLV